MKKSIPNNRFKTKIGKIFYESFPIKKKNMAQKEMEIWRSQKK